MLASRETISIAQVLLLLIAAAGVCAGAVNEVLSSSVTISPGAINGVSIECNGHRLVIYGDPLEHWKTADMVLLTHSRRDVVWAARAMVEGGAKSIVPAREKEQFSKVEDFWTSFWDKRFHDYEQQSTRIITTALRVDQIVHEGTPLSWQGLEVQVLDTPGYTRGAVSYFVEVDGRKFGFVGDLIYGDGHLMDLYSLQDAVPEAKIGGYHGYAGRIGDLIASLRKVAAQKADILVPARGPVLRDPAAAIYRLIERLQAVYENYLSISAGRWYFRDQYDTLAARALGRVGSVPWMPYARTVEKQPLDWIVPIENSRLLLSRDRSGFLIDCGSQVIINEIRTLKDQGRLVSLDGLFITHYHDDHTDKVNELLQEYHCPVYATPVLEDVLKRPGAYRLPCETMNAIEQLEVVADGHRMAWKEFTLTFYDFPGQTIYHDAMLAQRDTGETIFFIGDSFTPSGIDDYCLQNRNLLHDGAGFPYCLDLVLNRIPPDTLLVNEHVRESFRFDTDQVKHMERVLARRRELLHDLSPWDEPDFGIDEQWARIYPYGQEIRPEHWAALAVKLLNHSNTPNTFRVTLNAPAGCEIEPSAASVTAAPGEEVEARFRIRTPGRPSRAVQVVTADIQVGPWELRQWCEGLLKVLP
jgi:glyoxylase-like metal-dependent hydrolase (beta-lactamase superfamily II)